MSQFVKPGDLVDLSLEGKTERYVIDKVEMPLVYMHPENLPSHISGMELTPLGWRIKGAENLPFKVKFVSAEKPLTVTDDEAAEICLNVILRRVRDLDEDTLAKLQMYSQMNKLPEITKEYRSIREGCDSIFRSIFARKFPEVNVERLSAQNLARQYELEKQRLKKEELAQLVERTKNQLWVEEIEQAKMKYKGMKVCTNKPTIETSLFPLIDDSLIRRRVSLPMDQWQRLFNPFANINLSEDPGIQQRFYNLTRTFPEGLSNEVILGVIGEERVRQILNLPELPQGQVYLKLSANGLETYAIIAETHGEDYSLWVSPFLMEELAVPQDPIKIEDCTLEQVASITLRMFRLPEPPEISDEEIKPELVEVFADLGIPIVGDTLLVTVKGHTLTYFIEKIVTVSGKEVPVAAVPPASEDIRINLSVDTKEEYLRKLKNRISSEFSEELV